MARKKRKRRRTGAASSSPSGGTRPAAAAATDTGRGAASGRSSPARGRRGLFGGDRRPSGPGPFPAFGVSFARGLAAVGRSPALLLSAFLAALVLWFAFHTYGVVLAASPAAMVQLESLAPIHSLLDVQFLSGGEESTASVAVGFGVGLLLVRASLLALWSSLSVEALRRGPVPTGRSGRWGLEWGAVGPALRQAARVMPQMVAVEAGFLILTLMALAFLVGLGAALGQLGVMGALLALLYFLVFTPIVLVTEQVGIRDAVRLSVRAARLPGSRHMILTFGYLMLTLFLSLSTPPSRVARATPSILVWAYVLFVSFLHLSVLAAFAFRWLAVRRIVLPQDGGENASSDAPGSGPREARDEGQDGADARQDDEPGEDGEPAPHSRPPPGRGASRRGRRR